MNHYNDIDDDDDDKDDFDLHLLHRHISTGEVGKQVILQARGRI